jgi:hypothetical protein
LRMNGGSHNSDGGAADKSKYHGCQNEELAHCVPISLGIVKVAALNSERVSCVPVARRKSLPRFVPVTARTVGARDALPLSAYNNALSRPHGASATHDQRGNPFDRANRCLIRRRSSRKWMHSANSQHPTTAIAIDMVGTFQLAWLAI